MASFREWWNRWRCRKQTMSSHWIANQHRVEHRGGVEQSRIQRWPINKVQNESAWFNARRLKRA